MGVQYSSRLHVRIVLAISSPSFEVALWIRGRLPCDGFDNADLTSWKVTLCARRTASPDISAIRLLADASGVALPSPWYSSPVQGRSLSSALGSVLPRAICVAGHGTICPPLPHRQTCQVSTPFSRADAFVPSLRSSFMSCTAT